MLALLYISAQIGLGLSPQVGISPVERCEDRYAMLCIKDSDLLVEKLLIRNGVRIVLTKKYWIGYYYTIDIPTSLCHSTSKEFNYKGSSAGFSKIGTSSRKCNISIRYKYENKSQLDDLLTSLFTEIRLCATDQCSNSSLSEVVLPANLKSDIVGERISMRETRPQ